MLKRNNTLALFTGLLFLAAQLVSVVHAAEHPFHSDSEICASFFSLEQHDSMVAQSAGSAGYSSYSDDFNVRLLLREITSSIYTGQARAPPRFT